MKDLKRELIDFANDLNEVSGFALNPESIPDFVDDWLKSINSDAQAEGSNVGDNACKSHNIRVLPYLQWHEWAEQQYEKGINQYQCSKCKRWLFPEEI